MYLILVSIVLLFTSLSHSEIILTMGGDLNLSPSLESPNTKGTCKRGSCYSWEELFGGIEPLLIGQLNFYNLETVVTGGPKSLSPKGGKFLFRSHMEGIRHAQRIGLNWISLANNHAGDYGSEGMAETLQNLRRLDHPNQPLFAHGIGNTKGEVVHPLIFELESETEGRVHIAFAAITFVRNSPMTVTPGVPGVLDAYNKKDLALLMKNFRATEADFKVLSIHGGKEKYLGLDSGQRKLYHSLLEGGDLDLIIGHHPHRVRPVERVGEKVIFYSLGNYLMLGAERLNDLDDANDFGLMGRVHLRRKESGRLSVISMEAIPLFNLHARTYPLTGEEASQRIQSLNSLTSTELGSEGVLWKLQANGWGFYE